MGSRRYGDDPSIASPLGPPASRYLDDPSVGTLRCEARRADEDQPTVAALHHASDRSFAFSVQIHVFLHDSWHNGPRLNCCAEGLGPLVANWLNRHRLPAQGTRRILIAVHGRGISDRLSGSFQPLRRSAEYVLTAKRHFSPFPGPFFSRKRSFDREKSGRSAADHFWTFRASSWVLNSGHVLRSFFPAAASH